jgi:hypothetical protein
MLKTKDEDKQNKTHNTICVGRHRTQDKRRRQTKQTIQQNMCWRPPYKIQNTKTIKTNNTRQYVLDTTIPNTKDEDKQKKTTTQYVLGTITHKTKDEDKKTTKKQHNMWWTTPYRRKKTKTNKTKNTTQYVLDTTIHKTKDEDKQNKKHNTICVGHHHTQDKRGRQTNQKTQHNMCCKPPCTRQKTKTSKTKHTTQYVLDDTIHKTKY